MNMVVRTATFAALFVPPLVAGVLAAAEATAAPQASTPVTSNTAPGSLRVRVVDGVTGDGLSGVSLSMRCVGTTMYGRDFVTNDAGEFTIDDLGDDQCMAMVAHREGYRRDLTEMRYLEASNAVHVMHLWPVDDISGRAPTDVFVRPGESGAAVLITRAARAPALRVELEYDGDPGGGRVLLGLDRLDAPPGTRSSRMLQVDGTAFAVDGLVQGRYAFRTTGVPTGYAITRVVANGRDVTAEGFDPLTVTGPIVVTLSNRLATIEGRIVTADGNEASAATVVVLAANPMARVVRIVQATQRGRFAVGNLPPGDYAIVAVRTAALPPGLAFSPPGAADPALATRLLPHAVRISVAAHETTSVELREGAV